MPRATPRARKPNERSQEERPSTEAALGLARSAQTESRAPGSAAARHHVRAVQQAGHPGTEEQAHRVRAPCPEGRRRDGETARAGRAGAPRGRLPRMQDAPPPPSRLPRLPALRRPPTTGGCRSGGRPARGVNTRRGWAPAGRRVALRHAQRRKTFKTMNAEVFLMMAIFEHKLILDNFCLK